MTLCYAQIAGSRSADMITGCYLIALISENGNALLAWEAVRFVGAPFRAELLPPAEFY